MQKNKKNKILVSQEDSCRDLRYRFIDVHSFVQTQCFCGMSGRDNDFIEIFTNRRPDNKDKNRKFIYTLVSDDISIEFSIKQEHQVQNTYFCYRRTA